MERISGPYKGYYIAAYTVGNRGHITGYAKVCIDPPNDVWHVSDVQKLITIAGFREELEAIAAAERGAREAIADILGNTDPITAPGELR
ncbi:MAG: hypothetical protein V4787_24760 [Pseudomonadota bacterium]